MDNSHPGKNNFTDNPVIVKINLVDVGIKNPTYKRLENCYGERVNWTVKSPWLSSSRSAIGKGK